MTKMIQVRNVPDDVHKKLKVRAAQQGMTLSDYLNRELLHIAQAPTIDEMIEWSRRQTPIKLEQPIEDMIRADRESH